MHVQWTFLTDCALNALNKYGPEKDILPNFHIYAIVFTSTKLFPELTTEKKYCLQQFAWDKFAIYMLKRLKGVNGVLFLLFHCWFNI